MSQATLPGPLARLAGLLGRQASRPVTPAAYTAKKREIDGLLTALQANDLANCAPLQALIAAAAVEAAKAPPDYAAALAKLNLCPPAHATALAAAVALGKSRTKYTAILPKATQSRDKLKAKKLPGQDFHTELETNLTDAADLATQKKFAEAFAKLSDHKEKYNAALARYQTAVSAALTPDARAQAASLENARFQPIYTQRLQQVTEGLARLKALSHTAPITAQIETLVTEARAQAAATPPNFEAAHRKLAAFTRLSGEAQAAHDRGAAAVGGPEFQAALQVWRTALADARRTLTPAKVAELDAAGQRIITAAASAPAPATAQKTLIGAETLKINQAVGAAQAELANVNRELPAVRAVLTELNTVADAPVVAPFQTDLQNAEVLLGLKNYTEALAVCTRVKAAAGPVLTAEKAKKTAWEAALAAVAPRRTRVQAVVADGSPQNKTNQAKAAKLINAIQAAEALATAKKFTEATAKLASVAIAEPDVAALEAEKTFVGGFNALIGQLDRELTALATETDTALRALAAAGGSEAPFRTQIKAATEPWEKVKEEAFKDQTPAADREAKTRTKLSAAGNLAKAGMTRIKTAVADTTTTPGLLADNKKAGEAEKAAAEARAAVAALREFDLAEARTFDRRLDAALAVEDVPTRLTQLKAVKTEADAARTTRAGAIAATRRTASATAAAVATRIGELRSTAPGKYGAYFDTVQNELDELKGMVDSTVETVVAQASAGLTTLLAKVRAMPGYEGIHVKKEAVKALLGNASLKATKPKRAKALEAEFKEIRKSIRTQSPTDALATLNNFERTAVQPAVDAAIAAAAQRSTIASRATVVKAAVAAAKSDLLADTPKLVAQLEKRVTAAEAVKEDEEPLSIARLQAVDDEIAIVRSRPELRITKEQQVGQEEQDQQRAAAEWQGKITVFEQVVYKKAKEALAGAAEAERDKGGEKQLDKLFKEMKKFAKQKNFEVANIRLDEGTLLGNRLAANPQGARATARGELKKLNKAWKEAATAFSTGCNALIQKITDETTADPAAIDAPKLAKLKTQLTKLAQTFNPLAFQAVITIMDDRDKPVNERRAAREQGLREVRRYVQLAKGDPLAKELVNNPWSVAADIEPIKRKLADLDLNLQRGL